MTVAVDTSVAVPLLVRSHQHHAEVVRWWAGQELALSGHVLAATYSVLTRLPGDARLSAEDAARLLDARFTTPRTLSGPPARTVHATLSRLGIAGAPCTTGWWPSPPRSTAWPSPRETHARAGPITRSESR